MFILKSILSQAKIYPFSKTDPYSEALFILCIFFHQFFYFVFSYYIYYDDISRQNLFRIYSSIFDHFLCFFPLIYKINSVTKLFKYSYQHLSLYYSDEIKSEKEKDKKINNIDINTNNNGKIYEEFYKDRAENPKADRNMAFIILFCMTNFTYFLCS